MYLCKTLVHIVFSVYALGVTFTLADELDGEKRREMNCLVDLKWDAENILFFLFFFCKAVFFFLQHLCLIQERMSWNATSQATCSLSAVIIVCSSKTAVITHTDAHARTSVASALWFVTSSILVLHHIVKYYFDFAKACITKHFLSLPYKLVHSWIIIVVLVYST